MSVDKEFSYDAHSRRRSVDVGGLALALGAVSLGGESGEMGKGWGGWEEGELKDAMYAELLSSMYTQTQFAVNQPILPALPAISVGTRRLLIDALDSWHFEPHKLPDEEVLACTQLLFEALYRVEGMEDAVGVSLAQLSSFLLHLRAAYRAANSYHNFQHALDVFQATHVYLRFAGIVPPVSILNIPETDPRGRWRVNEEVQGTTWAGILRKTDVFALYIAAVGHDVGHPGFNNMFMKNAQAPLSQVYDHKSALEQMHCAFLLPIMKRHGLAHLLDSSYSGAQFRRLLLDTVLATDMGVHAQFMQRFTHLMEKPGDFSNVEARTLLCQALIKCADISNPSRPHAVSQHWSAALASEWANQASLERQLCLPVSVQDSDDPMTEANGQISFINLFCAPLLELTAAAIPEMKCFAEQCSRNRHLWRTRLAELKERAEPNYPPIPYRAMSPPQQPQADLMTVFPLSLPSQFFRPFTRVPSEMDAESIVSVGNVDLHARSMSDQMRMDGIESPGLPPRREQERARARENGANANGYARSAAAAAAAAVAAPYPDSAPSSSRSPSPILFTNGFSSPPAPARRAPSTSTSTSTDTSTDTSTAHRLPPAIGIPPTGFPRSTSTSDYPSPTSGSASASPSPRSEFAVPRTPGARSVTTSMSMSQASSGVGGGGGGGEGSAADASIRAAYKLSVRRKKSFHRNSWAPGPPPPPVPPLPQQALGVRQASGSGSGSDVKMDADVI